MTLIETYMGKVKHAGNEPKGIELWGLISMHGDVPKMTGSHGETMLSMGSHRDGMQRVSKVS